MQFSSILAALSLAMAATAVPNASSASSVPVKTSSTAPPAKTAAPSCSTSQTASCCSAVLKDIGIDCVTLSLLSLLDLQCPQAASVACCNTSGVQNGLVNIGTICIPVSVVV